MDSHGLSERKKQLLKAIVVSHIENGEPVGSKTLMENQHLDVSSATIRNEMAELEHLGFLEKPHTSAGRIPSELGYRFYVDSLIEDYATTTNEISQIDSLMKVKMGELNQILSEASNLVSKATNYPAIAIRSKVLPAKFVKFECIYISECHFILIMVDSLGNVKNKHFDTAENIDENVVTLLSGVLNHYLIGIGPDEINLPILMEAEKEIGNYSWLLTLTMKGIYEMVSESENTEMQISGINHLLEYPEYSNTEDLQGLLSTLEKKDDILKVVSKLDKKENVNVVIGHESEVKVLDKSTLVLKPIIKDGKPIAAIGVIGPTRMEYAKVLATLEEMSGNIASLINTENKGGLLSDGRERKDEH